MEQQLTFNDVFSIRQVMRIFNQKSQAAIIGKQPHRLMHKYGWTVLHAFGKRVFLRSDILKAACFQDAVDDGKLPPLNFKNEPIDGYPVNPSTVKATRLELQRRTLAALLPLGSTRLERFSEEVTKAPRYPDTPILKYATADDMAKLYGMTKETIYRWSDFRNGSALVTVKFGGRRLWVPDVSSFPDSDQTNDSTVAQRVTANLAMARHTQVMIDRLKQIDNLAERVGG